MESTNIIAILLFIIPGVVAEKISNRMDMPASKNQSDFGELVSGILWSIPIITIVGFMMCAKYKLKTISNLSTSLGNISFILEFFAWTLGVAVIIGTIIGVFKDKIIDVVNFVRVTIFKRIRIDDKSCWRKMFLDKNEAQYIEININLEDLLNSFELDQDCGFLEVFEY